MKFDIIIGNPPYQENTSDSSNQGKPIYNQFVDIFKSLNPQKLSFIIPSRWFAGGMGLDSFRKNMLEDKCMKTLVDYNNAKDCFPSNSISGGICYFYRDANYTGDCNVININGDKKNEMIRSLDEYKIFVRYNEAVSIIRKVCAKSDKTMMDIISAISPFGISTKIRGNAVKDRTHNIELHTSKGIGYICAEDVKTNFEYVNKYKVLLSQTSAEHANEPSKDGKYRVLTSSMKVIGKNAVCTHSYLIINPCDSEETCKNILKYLNTKFVRYLLLQAMSSIHITSSTFVFVPKQNFESNEDIDWSLSITDINKQLYKKYDLTCNEIESIESKIKDI